MPTFAAGTSTPSLSTWLVTTIGYSPLWNRSRICFRSFVFVWCVIAGTR